jgi:hypothetical protein
MQKFYFSGLSGPKETQWLRDCGVASVLADPADFGRCEGFRDVALDSGAYRAYKAGRVLTEKVWFADLAALPLDRLDFMIQPDVLGDPAATRARWDAIRRERDRCRNHWLGRVIPVWQWGASGYDLRQLLDQCNLVAVGGLVPLMRAKDDAMLAALTALCERHGASLHLLGLNWLKAFDQLSPMIFSADTSKWLDGARYGHALFQHTRTGRLSQAPARAIPDYADLDREGRTKLAIRTLMAAAGIPETPRPVPLVGPDGGRLQQLYQIGRDGYPDRGDTALRDGYGPILRNGWNFAPGIKVYGWNWSTTFGRWTALVELKNGWFGWSYPELHPGMVPAGIRVEAPARTGGASLQAVTGGGR